MATIPIVDTADKRKGILAAIIAMIGLALYLLLTNIELADPPPKVPEVITETILPEEIDLKDFVVEGGANAGSPTDDKIAPPTPQTEQVVTTNKQSTFTHQSGQSTHTNANNSNNSASTTRPSDNPFGTGGENGTTGPGRTVGNSTGPGVDGPGSGSGIVRKLVTPPNVDHLEFSERATITFSVTIDAQGNVVRADVVYSKTTTNDQLVINKIRNEVLRQAKYNKDPGAALTKVILSVNVAPQ